MKCQEVVSGLWEATHRCHSLDALVRSVPVVMMGQRSCIWAPSEETMIGPAVGSGRGVSKGDAIAYGTETDPITAPVTKAMVSVISRRAPAVSPVVPPTRRIMAARKRKNMQALMSRRSQPML